MAFPHVTKVLHDTEYPSISPARPELSTTGKSVLITGGGAGAGPAIAKAFAIAGSTQIALLGRTQKTLEATKLSLEAEFSGIEVLALVADIVDKPAVDAAFAATKTAFGRIDVLVSNAAYFPVAHDLATAPLEDWWKGYQVNILGNFHLLQAYIANLDTTSPFQPTVVNVSTGGAHLPAISGLSGYATSKFAGFKLFEYFAAENTNIRVMNVHPGVLETPMGQRGRDGGMLVPWDDVSLPAGFIVWSVSAEAEFLKNRILWANWDVDELKDRKEEFEGTSKFTMQLAGWP